MATGLFLHTFSLGHKTVGSQVSYESKEILGLERSEWDDLPEKSPGTCGWDWCPVSGGTVLRHLQPLLSLGIQMTGSSVLESLGYKVDYHPGKTQNRSWQLTEQWPCSCQRSMELGCASQRGQENEVSGVRNFIGQGVQGPEWEEAHVPYCCVDFKFHSGA